ncbi:MAG: nucleotidyltransferase family protein [Nocardioidaceae bacterium]
MEAVIIAGGLGVRLLPLTEHCPKHLLPVAGIPFVVHQLTKLAEADIGRVVLATSYLADQFEPVLGDGSRWGIELVYVREQTPLGTGGAISNAAIHLRSKTAEPVVIFNGDILSGHDLSAQIAQHRDREAEVTLHLVEVEDARAFGCVPTDDAGNVLGFVEKSPNPVSRQINAGCYVFTSEHFRRDLPGPGVSRAGDVSRVAGEPSSRHGLPRQSLLARRRDARCAAPSVGRRRPRDRGELCLSWADRRCLAG